MDVMQVVRIAVMAAEVWGKYSGKRGEEKLRYAIELVRGIEPRLVESEKQIAQVVESIELVIDEFDERGWDQLSALAGGVKRIAERVRKRIVWLSERVSWVREKIAESGNGDVDPLTFLDGD